MTRIRLTLARLLRPVCWLRGHVAPLYPMYRGAPPSVIPDQWVCRRCASVQGRPETVAA